MNGVDTRITYGRINLRNQGGMVACFKLEPPFKWVSAANSGRMRQGTRTSVSATDEPEIGKGFTSQVVEHPEGTVIMIQAGRTRRGAPIADSYLFLRLRSSGPCTHVQFKLPVDDTCLLGDRIVAFSGRADVMTYEQLRVFGYDMPATRQAAYLSEEERDELFVIGEIAPETAPRPGFQAVITNRGVRTEAVSLEAPRRLRLRRGPA